MDFILLNSSSVKKVKVNHTTEWDTQITFANVEI